MAPKIGLEGKFLVEALTKAVVIPNGATGLSAEVDLEDYVLLKIHMPAAWQAAVLTMMAAPVSGGTFYSLYDDQGNEVTIQAAASRCIGVDVAAGAIAGLRYVKFRSGTAALAVDQTADRTLTLILARP